MSNDTRKTTLTVSQRLATLGLATFLGIGSMLAVGWYENRQVSAALDRAEAVRDDVGLTSVLRHTSTELTLAAMNAIVDKAGKAIDPARLKEIGEAVAALKAGEARIASIAASIGKPELANGVAANIDMLARSIQVDLKGLIETGADAAAFDEADDRIDAAGERLSQQLVAVSEGSKAAMRDRLVDVDASSSHALFLQLVCGLASMATVIGLLYLQGNILRRGIFAVRDSMRRVLSGDYATSVEAVDRGDEIGEMARCVDQFRADAIDKQALERNAAANRSQHDNQRREREASAAEDAHHVQIAVSALGQALNRLADGQLTVAISQPFRTDLESLRLDFNQAVEKLRAVMSSMRDNSASITANGRQMRSAADDLARRTEQQAASLEETSAALDQITVTVRTATQKAEEASRMVGQTHASAEESGRIVREAVAAMARIEDASSEIGKIINVIDEIAFQTNLLALNAGVEAARAGEAGKGFAVVAQEVRELAQRAAGAAKDIKGLVSRSSAEVGTGVRLVQETGAALGRIGNDVDRINEYMGSIVVAAREQSTGLTEINTAIGQLDQMTQQNAAMVEETNAASHTLAQDAESLSSLIEQFSIGAQAEQAHRGTVGSVPAQRPAPPSGGASPVPARPARQTVRPAGAGSRPAPSPAKALMGKLAGAFHSSQAAAPAPRSTDNWEEF